MSEKTSEPFPVPEFPEKMPEKIPEKSCQQKRCCYVDEKSIRCMVIVFNALIMICGGAYFGVSIWMISDKTLQNFLEIFKDINNGAGIFTAITSMSLATGIIMICACILGIVGAIKKSPSFLGLNVLCFILLLFFEITIIGLTSAFNSKLGKNLNEGMIKQVSEHVKPLTNVNNDELSEAWSYLQNDLKCCGASNFTEYKKNSNFDSNPANPVPKSCCVTYTRSNQDQADSKYSQCFNEFRSNAQKTIDLQREPCYEKLKKRMRSRAQSFNSIFYALVGLQPQIFIWGSRLRQMLLNTCKPLVAE